MAYNFIKFIIIHGYTHSEFDYGILIERYMIKHTVFTICVLIILILWNDNDGFDLLQLLILFMEYIDMEFK